MLQLSWRSSQMLILTFKYLQACCAITHMDFVKHCKKNCVKSLANNTLNHEEAPYKIGRKFNLEINKIGLKVSEIIRIISGFFFIS